MRRQFQPPQFIIDDDGQFVAIGSTIFLLALLLKTEVSATLLSSGKSSELSLRIPSSTLNSASLNSNSWSEEMASLVLLYFLANWALRSAFSFSRFDLSLSSCLIVSFKSLFWISEACSFDILFAFFFWIHAYNCIVKSSFSEGTRSTGKLPSEYWYPC